MNGEAYADCLLKNIGISSRPGGRRHLWHLIVFVLFASAHILHGVWGMEPVSAAVPNGTQVSVETLLRV